MVVNRQFFSRIEDVGECWPWLLHSSDYSSVRCHSSAVVMWNYDVRIEDVGERQPRLAHSSGYSPARCHPSMVVNRQFFSKSEDVGEWQHWLVHLSDYSAARRRDVMNTNYLHSAIGPEYSSDNAGDGPVGKAVGRKNKERVNRMQNKES